MATANVTFMILVLLTIAPVSAFVRVTAPRDWEVVQDPGVHIAYEADEMGKHVLFIDGSEYLTIDQPEGSLLMSGLAQGFHRVDIATKANRETPLSTSHFVYLDPIDDPLASDWVSSYTRSNELRERVDLLTRTINDLAEEHRSQVETLQERIRQLEGSR